MDEQQQQTSPVPPAKQGPSLLTFAQAIDQIIDNKKVTRVEWGDEKEYGMLKNGWLMVHTKGEDHIWQVSDGDLLAFDWYVVEEKSN